MVVLLRINFQSARLSFFVLFFLHFVKNIAACSVHMSETGRLRLRRAGPSDTVIYSNGAPYVANQWYKVDVTVGKKI